MAGGRRLQVAVAGSVEFAANLRRALDDAGIEIVAECTNRPEAIRVVRTGRPDLCIVDRDLDGGGLITAAAIASPRQPIVIVVGPGSPAERRAVRLAGATASLPHDSSPTELAALVLELARKEQR
jgi:DNA-binding NarL/FixJ family response regulator